MLDPNEFIGRAIRSEDGSVVLTLEGLERLLNELSEAEAKQCMDYAFEDPEQFCERATAWLIKRFDLRFMERQ